MCFSVLVFSLSEFKRSSFLEIGESLEIFIKLEAVLS